MLNEVEFGGAVQRARVTPVPRRELAYRLVPMRPGMRAAVDPVIKVTGYAARFFELSQVIVGEKGSPYRYREMIWPDAFRDSLLEDDVTFNPEHQTSSLGSTENGALRLEADAGGLRFRFTPPRSAAGEALIARVRLGAFTGMSIRFSIERSLWLHEDSDCPIRALKKASLIHISTVSRPAFPTTSIQIETQA